MPEYHSCCSCVVLPSSDHRISAQKMEVAACLPTILLLSAPQDLCGGARILLFTSPSASVAFLHLVLAGSVQDIARGWAGNCKEQMRISGGKRAA